MGRVDRHPIAGEIDMRRHRDHRLGECDVQARCQRDVSLRRVTHDLKRAGWRDIDDPRAPQVAESVRHGPTRARRRERDLAEGERLRVRRLLDERRHPAQEARDRCLLERTSRALRSPLEPRVRLEDLRIGGIQGRARLRPSPPA